MSELTLEAFAVEGTGSFIVHADQCLFQIAFRLLKYFFAFDASDLSLELSTLHISVGFLFDVVVVIPGV